MLACASRPAERILEPTTAHAEHQPAVEGDDEGQRGLSSPSEAARGSRRGSYGVRAAPAWERRQGRSGAAPVSTLDHLQCNADGQLLVEVRSESERQPKLDMLAGVVVFDARRGNRRVEKKGLSEIGE